MKTTFSILLLLSLTALSLSATCPSNCNDCDPTGKICLACGEGFELSVMGSCVANTIVDKCIVYGPTNQCFVCQPTFQFIGNTCQKTYTGCLSSDPTTGNCLNCGLGTVLRNNACSGAINCATNSSPCSSCLTGFSLQNGNCRDASANCASTNSNGVCTNCNPNFKLIGYQCIPQSFSVYACYIYDNIGICYACKNGYTLYQNNCILSSQLQSINQGTTTLAAILAQRGGSSFSTSTTTNSNGGGSSFSSFTISNATNNTSTSLNNQGDFGGFGGNLGGSTSFSSNGGSPTTATGTNQTSASTTSTTSTTTTTSFDPNFDFSGGFSNSGSNTVTTTTGSSTGTTGSSTGTTGSSTGTTGSSSGSSNTSGSQTVASIDNCQVPDPQSSSKCLICFYGWYPSGNQCVAVSSFCNTFDVTNGNCFSCKYGLSLQNGVCTDQNCKAQLPSGCQACVTGFALNSNKVCAYSDPNCATINGNRCDNCVSGYFVTITGGCQVLPAGCAIANIQTLSCLQCSQGFTISNGICNKAIVYPPVANCLTPDPNGPKCLVCNTGYYPSGITCAKVSALCGPYDPTTGKCISCLPNYQLNNGICYDIYCQVQNGDICSQCKPSYALKTPTGNCQYVQPVLPNCQTVDPTNPQNCLTCNSGYAFLNNQCTKIAAPTVANCGSYNLITGVCLSCIAGFSLQNNVCVVVNNVVINAPSSSSGFSTGASTGSSSSGFNGASTGSSTTTTTVTVSGNTGSSSGNTGSSTYVSGNTGNTGTTTTDSSTSSAVVVRDPNCAKYTGAQCISCSNRYYFNAVGLCTPVNPLCKSYLLTGNCSDCYPGYTLSSGSCVIARLTDPNCKTADSFGNCQACYSGFFLNSSSICQSLNPLCKTSNLNNGFCLTCYPGYSLNAAGLCSVAFKDPNCQKYDASGVICLQCSTRYILDSTNNNQCKSVSPLCKGYDSISGACTSCYQGYTIIGTTCTVGIAANSDVNCQNYSNGNCLNCYNGYYLNFQGKCSTANPLCKTYDTTNGNCLTCYPGYSVSNGNCSVSVSSSGSSDANCKTFANGVCQNCYGGYYLPQGGNQPCTRLDPLCKTYIATLDGCSTCYDGYGIFSNKCVVAVLLQSANNDTYCIKSQGTQCLQCASGFYIAQSGVCTQLNSLCQTSNLTNGNCLSCYPGYTLANGNCTVTQVVQIAYCSSQNNGYCSSCINGYYLSNNQCNAVSVLCGTYDQNSGQCLTCIPGYFFQQNQCIYPSMGVDPACTYYQGSFCSTCQNGYYLSSYVCTPIDPFCLQFNSSLQLCNQCSNNKTPQGAICV